MASLLEFILSQPKSCLVLLAVCLYYTGLAFYRLYLCPLAKFPGPKLAALTFWVEFYHDVLRRGQYEIEIGKMHEKYGPIVRITPDELHINDRDFIDEIYPGAQKQTEKPPSVRALGIPLSVVSTIPHNLHKMRRAALNRFFSKKSVHDYSGLIQSTADKLCERFEEFQKSKAPIDLRVAYAALSIDVISVFCYGTPYDTLSKPDMEPAIHKTITSNGELALLLKHYPWVVEIANPLPSRLVAWLSSHVSAIIQRKVNIERQIQAIIDADKNSDSPKPTSNSPTIFHELLHSDMPASERSRARLVDDGIALIGAGTVTTAHVLSTVSYHLLANPPMLSRLQSELHAAIPDISTTPPLTRLETLPYLGACIKEGLRVSHPVSHRSARVAPNRALQFRHWTIPPATTVSMTACMLHMDPDLYPSPTAFRPERWLAPTPQQQQQQQQQPTEKDSSAPPPALDKYLIPFGRGSRICLGMNLATAELHMTLAAVFRRFDLRLYQTTDRDVEVVHDFIVGSERLDSKGIRVVVEGLRG